MIKRRVSIIGAGKVGSAIACLLFNKNYRIANVYSKSIKSAQVLADRVRATAIVDSSSIVSDTDIVLITTPDSEIANITNLLARLSESGVGKFIFHTCGSQSSEVLEPLKKNGWCIGSLHPLQAFADIETAIRTLPNTYFAIDGDTAAQLVAKDMIQAIGGQSFYVPSQQRALYHAAACMASNYTVALLHVASQLLSQVGISEAAAMKALTPLMQGTFTNIQEQGTIKALTGPIVRGDALTIAKHQEAIKAVAMPTAELYKVMGRYAQGIANQRQCLSAEQDRALTDLLH